MKNQTAIKSVSSLDASCEPDSMMSSNRKKIGSNLIFVSSLVLISLIMSYYLCEGCRSDTRRFILLGSFCFSLWIFLWPGNSLLARQIDKKVSWIETPGKRFFIGIFSTIAYSVSILLLTIWIFEHALNFPLGSSTMGTIVYTLAFTIVCSLFLYGQRFLRNWRKLELDAAKLRNENLSSRFESLKNQLDPHFLFNSLNVLTNLVYEDADKSARFIKQLSEVYRYVLDTRGKEFVTLKEEMQFVDAYLYLQQIRFGNKLTVRNKLADLEGHLPPLVIQMLLENAIKHNTISSENPLVIDLYEDDRNVVVENNLQLKDTYSDSLGIGLDNIRKRYELLSDRPVNVSDENGKFRVSLPLLTVHE
ncbi:MAG: histidine kinase [Chryseolinea sp.]